MKLEVNISKKSVWVVSLIACMFIFGFLVYAYAPGSLNADPSFFGHSANEIHVSVDDGQVPLEGAISDLYDRIEALQSQVGSIPGTGLFNAKVENISFNSYTGSTTCVLMQDGGVRCTGGNNKGQLGLGDVTNRNTYTQVPSITSSSRVIALYGGKSSSCVVNNTGGVKCWGNNDYGQLGDGTKLQRNTPVDVIDSTGNPLIGVKKLAVRYSSSGDFVCALMTSGKINCWGYNGKGQLGIGTTTDSSRAVEVSSITNAVDVQLGGLSTSGFACALLSSGTVSCWGYNGYGQLGVGAGDKKDKWAPTSVSGLSNVKAITVSESDQGSVCALINDGTVKCWGRNNYGQLGVADKADSGIPQEVDNIGVSYPKATKIKLASSTNVFACALLDNGQMKCWGYNGNGQLGVGAGDKADKTVPTSVSSLNNVIDFESTGYGSAGFTCALINDGTVKCWGYNGYGQLGVGDKVTPVTEPKSVLGVSNAVKLYLNPGQGNAQSGCAILSDRTIRCWGKNDYGQLGVGNTANPILTPQAPV